MINEFLTSLSDISPDMTIVFIAFSLGIAIFQSVILSVIYEFTLPRWFFFVLNPTLIAASYFINPLLSSLMFFLLVASIFVLGIFGILYQSLRKTFTHFKWLNQKHPPQARGVILLKTLAAVALIAALVTVPPHLLFILIAAFSLLAEILPNSKNRFLRLQSVLPTAQIRSMPMGLIEVQGKVTALSPLPSPLDKKVNCIGYRYLRQEAYQDHHGDTRYTTLSDEVFCHDFMLTDSSGTVKVLAEELSFLWLPLHTQFSRGGVQHSQFLLLENTDVLVVGMAADKDQQKVLIKEPIKQIFTLTPSEAVNRWNKYLPLLHSFITFSMLIAAVSAFILMADISTEGNRVSIRY